MGKATVGIGLMGAWHRYIYKFSNMMFKGFQKKRHWIYPCTYPECRPVAAWDYDEERGKQLAGEYGCPFEADLDSFLDNDDIDAVVICTPTSMHTEHIIRAAKAGKHIFVEKSPFSSLEGAYLARDAIKKSGIHFMVSSPMDKPRNRFAKDLLDSGKLGTVTEIRFRLHDKWAIDNPQPVSILNKEEAWGGALIDYGQHGIHILNWMLGMPLRVSAHFGYVTDFAKQYHIEDNAAAVFEFENGVLGIVETGWTAPDHECMLDIYGTKGRVHVMGDERHFSSEGVQTIADRIDYCLDGGNMIHVDNSELPAPLRYPLRNWIDNILSDANDDRQNIDEAVAWTEMLMAAYRSAGTGEPINI